MEAAAAHDASDLLPALAVPALIVAGERDRLVPASMVEEMATDIAGSEYLEVRGATHFLPLEYFGLLALEGVLDRGMRLQNLRQDPALEAGDDVTGGDLRGVDVRRDVDGAPAVDASTPTNGPTLITSAPPLPRCRCRRRS